MKKVLFIDRDGTILEEPEDEQVDSLGKFRFIPGAITGLVRIATETDFELVMVLIRMVSERHHFPKKHSGRLTIK